MCRFVSKISDFNVITADETACWFDFASSTTVEKKGKKSIHMKTTGNEKAR